MTLIIAANSPKGKPDPEAILTTYHLLRPALTQWLAWADLTELVRKALSPGGIMIYEIETEHVYITEDPLVLYPAASP